VTSPDGNVPPSAALAPPQVPADVMAFRQGLQRRTPRVWATPALVATNVLVFVAMVFAGVGLMSPSVEGLITWGANYAPRTTTGQGWRLLSNVFVHIGVVHVAMNMIGLWQIGFLVERLLGNRGFLAVYFFSGVCGSLASVLWNPFVVSAGASGAVFGVYGALLAYLLRHRGSIPGAVLQPLLRSALIFVGLNVVYGFQAKGIDMAAHVGGFVAGFAATLVVGQPVSAGGGRAAAMREVVLVVLTAALVAFVPGRLPRTPDLQGALRDFDTMERSALAAYNGALQASGRSDAEIARIIDEQVLPPWRQFAERWQVIAAAKRLPEAQRTTVTQLSRYIGLRTQGWTLFSEALHTGDQAKADQAVALLKESERASRNKDDPPSGPASTEDGKAVP
jgi:rhomboid protease GluP